MPRNTNPEPRCHLLPLPDTLAADAIAQQTLSVLDNGQIIHVALDTNATFHGEEDLGQYLALVAYNIVHNSEPLWELGGIRDSFYAAMRVLERV